MEELKQISPKIIRSAKRNPKNYGLHHRDYGKSSSITDYSDREVMEMLYGIYKDTRFLKVDAGYFVNMSDVVKTICKLERVSTYNKSQNQKEKNQEFSIKNVRTFYVSDYLLETTREFSGKKRHSITQLLLKIGAINKGRKEFEGLFSNRNHYGTLQQFDEGLFPKDLYHPIKRYVNGMFFNNDYKISNFVVESDLTISLPKR